MMEALKQYGGLPRQVYLLCVVRVITCMGMFIYPFLTLLMKTRLGFNELQIGQVMLLIAGANISGSLLSGKLSDHIGRKRVYLASMFFCVVCLAAGGLVCERPAVIPLVVLIYFFVSMTMPALAAMLTDWSSDANRAECFSLLYLSTNIGFSVGPLLAGLLFYSHTPWIFWGQGVSFAAAGCLALFWIPGQISDRISGPASGAASGPDLCHGGVSDGAAASHASGDSAESGARGRDSLFRLVLRSPVLVCFVLCLAVLSLCYIQVDFILPLQVEELFGEETGSAYFGMLMAANGVVCVLATPLLVSWTKGKNQLRNIALAGILYAVGFGSYAVAGNIAVLIALVAVWTSGEVLVSTGAGVFIAEHSPPTHRARFQSLYEFSRGVGKAFGPTAFGWYLLSHRIASAWFLIGAICLATSAALFVLYRFDKTGGTLPPGDA